MDKLTLHHTSGAQPHYLYNLSLPLPERMHKRMFFPSGLAVAAWLGVSPQRIYCTRARKGRIWSEAQQAWFTVRIAHPQTTP